MAHHHPAQDPESLHHRQHHNRFHRFHHRRILNKDVQFGTIMGAGDRGGLENRVNRRQGTLLQAAAPRTRIDPRGTTDRQEQIGEKLSRRAEPVGLSLGQRQDVSDFEFYPPSTALAGQV